MEKQFFVYILTNKKNGTLYTGFANNLVRRIFEHKQKLVDGFSKKYGLDRLVYYEIYDDYQIALSREKNIKAWKRDWKINLIEQNNPEWKDLYHDIV